MIRTPARLCVYTAAALALFAPLAAQEQPGGFTLPQPTPTPTPAPAGPADERAGVSIPPRSVPAPRIEPRAVLTPQPVPPTIVSPLPTARSTPRPAIISPTPRPAPTSSGIPLPAAPDGPVAVPETEPATVPDSVPLPLPEASGAATPTLPAATPAPSFALPDWWLWAAGGLIGLAVLGAGLLLRRRRAPKVLRLAARPPGMGRDAPAADPATSHAPAASATELVPANALAISLDVVGATRSVMMFTLQYRLTLANRTAHAVGDVSLAVELACARRGASNGASPGAAQKLEQITRIGPHQTRTFTGEVQLPLSQIAPLRQGNLTLFIPLAHVTLEGEGQPAFARSFVIGTPSAAGTGRLHPIRLDIPPGSIPDLRAQSITIPVAANPSVSAAA